MALTTLPNIGKVLAAKLAEIGVGSYEDLVELGSEKAIIRIAANDPEGVCINMLYAIEGAVQGIRWHGLSADRKNELKQFFAMLVKNAL